MNGIKRSKLVRYGLAMFLVFAFALLQTIPTIGRGTGSLIFMVVFLSARYGGRGPGLLATGLLGFLATVGGTKDGHKRDAAETLQLVLFLASGPLITSVVEALKSARERSEKSAIEAHEQSERLHTTLQSIGDAVVVADQKGDVVSLNFVAERLTGWTQADAAGRPLREVFRIVNEETRQTVEDPVALVLTHKKTVELANHTILIARSGTEHPIDDSAAPIRDQQGQVVGVVLVFRDVSSRRDWERRLAEAEARFRAFMDNSPVAAFIKDEHGRYVWGNPAWLRLHKSRLGNPIGKSDAELWPEATAQLFRESDLVALASHGPIERAEQAVRPDGTVVHWMIMKFLLGEGAEGRLIGGIAVDVTERTLAEQAIRESESRYRLLFDANPHPMWVVDMETHAFLAVNKAAIGHYGYSMDEFLAMGIDRIHPSNETTKLNDRLRFPVPSPAQSQGLSKHVKKDGTVIDVEDASHPIIFNGRPSRIVLAQDVTERRKAEEALRISRERLDLVINGAELGLWYCDLPDGLLTLNDRARAHFGFGPNEIASLDAYSSRVHDDDRKTTTVAIRRAIEIRGSFDIVHRIGTDAPLPRWIRAIGRTFTDDAGVATRFDGISIDVTEQKQHEAQLREAKEAADVANKAKSKFLAMVGHELRTPLTPIVASVSAYLDNVDRVGEQEARWSHEEFRDLLTMIRRNVELETRLIGDLLDISRVERGQLKLDFDTVDLHEVIHRSIEICRDAINVAELDVRLDLAAESHHVRGDHARLMQIVWNVVHNAAKFSRSNGRLAIRTFELTPNGPGNPGHRVVAEFTDDGVGIDSDLLAKIFDPFEQGVADQRGRLSGLGLGLAICRSIAEAHGGELSATSPGQGHGSTFRLSLQVVPAPEVSSRSASTEPLREPARGRVLLVEDNVDTLRYLEILLRQHGYVVESARFLHKAITMAESSTFDILVSDLELPDGSGLDLMRLLRGKLIGIAVSGFGSTSDIEISLNAGFAAHLTKPVDFHRLDASIRQAVALDRPLTP
jgi:PAS domain S-box-containing protein